MRKKQANSIKKKITHARLLPDPGRVTGKQVITKEKAKITHACLLPEKTRPKGRAAG